MFKTKILFIATLLALLSGQAFASGGNGGTPDVTGDVAIPASTSISTLKTVNSNVGTFGDSTHTVTVTTNGKGLITAISQSSLGGTIVNSISNSDGTLTFSGSTGTVTASVNLTNANSWTGVQTMTSPILITPALGTPASGVMTNVSGTAANLTAGHVTTNANLTGVITSTGNATSIAAQTGTGSTFVVQTSPTITTPTISGHFVAEGVTTTGATGTGNIVFSVSPTFTGPALGTPISGVATNLTGTASALSIGGNAATVTTNHNMTGPITGTGNTTSITAQTGTGTTFVMDTSPTISSPTFTGPALGTPISGVATNLTGTAAALNIGGNAATATTAGTLTTAITANSVLGALTAVAPTALAIPSCSTSSSALKYTTGTGFGCNSAIAAATVTTNANLTGPITSSGNATSIAAQTGTGTTFVMSVAPTITGHPTIEGVTSTGATGTGAFVFGTSPTFTGPALGTPISGVATNLTGTATALNIGGNAATVTTNANLTGPITSSGNATTVAYIPSAISIGSTAAATSGTIVDMHTATSSLYLPVGTTGTRPGTPLAGMLRFNTDTPGMEVYTGAAWSSGGGGSGITALTGDVTASGTGSVAATVAKIAGVAVGTPTGTGNVVMSASPTLTGTIGAAAATFSGTITQTSTSASSFVSGANGATNPGVAIDNSTASAVTGIALKANAAGSGYALNVTSSGTNEAMVLRPKGNSNIFLRNSSAVNSGFNTTPQAVIQNNDSTVGNYDTIYFENSNFNVLSQLDVAAASQSAGTGSINWGIASASTMASWLKVTSGAAVNLPVSVIVGTTGTISSGYKIQGAGASGITDPTSSSAMAFMSSGSSTNGDYSGYDFSTAATTSPSARIAAIGIAASGTELHFLTQNVGPLIDAMKIDVNQAVAIGTSSVRNSAKLDVNGKINVGTFGSASTTPVCNNSSVLASCTVTGSGSIVQATSPALVTPALGAATATTLIAGTGSIISGTKIQAMGASGVTVGTSSSSLGLTVGGSSTNGDYSGIDFLTANASAPSTRIASLGIAATGTVIDFFTQSTGGLLFAARMGADQGLYIGTTSATSGAKLSVNGGIAQGTAISCSTGTTTNSVGLFNGCVASDESLKKLIESLVYDPDFIINISPRNYWWKDADRDSGNPRLHSGFIAQEVQKVMPSAVVPAGEGLLGVDPNAMLAATIMEVKEQRKRLDAAEIGKEQSTKITFYQRLHWLLTGE